MEGAASSPIGLDFETWDVLLRTSASSPNESLPLIIEATDLIFAVMPSGDLPPPLTENTAQFISVTIPRTLKKVLKVNHVNDDELGPILSFVQLSLTLCTWATSDPAQWKYACLFDVPGEVLLSSNPLYRAGQLPGGQDIGKIILANFVDSGEYSRIIKTIASNTPTLYIMKMAINIAVILGFTEEYESIVRESITMLETGMNRFLENLTKDDNMSRQNQEHLTEMIAQYMSLMQDMATSHTGWHGLLDFIGFCMRSDKLGNQLFGVTSLQSFLLFAKKKVIAVFRVWAAETGFLRYLIEKDFKNEVISQLMPVFSTLAEKNVFDIDVLWDLWKKALTVHSSQRISVFKLLAETMKRFDGDDSMKFVGSISETLTPEVVSFLCLVFPILDVSVGIQISDILFEAARGDNEIGKALSGAVASRVQSMLRDHLIDKSMEELKTASEKTLPALLLPKLVEQIWISDSASLTKYTQVFFDAIPYQHDLMFGVIGSLFCRIRRGVTPEEIRKLSKYTDCGFWDLMDTLIHALGSDATTEDGFMLLIEVIDGFDFKKSTVGFARFLSVFLRLRNFQAGYLTARSKATALCTKRPPEQFYFNHFPLFGMKYLFALMAYSENPEASQLGEDYLVTFITNYAVIDYEMVNCVISDFFLPEIQSANVPDVIRARYIKALLRVLRYAERDILFFTKNMIRHVLGSELLSVKLRTDKESFVVVTKKTVVLQQLEQCLARILNCRSVYLYGGPSLDKPQVGYNRTILELMPEADAKSITFRVRTNDRTSDTLTFTEIQSPSVVLRDKSFPEFLYGLLDNECLKNVAWQCLRFLPDGCEINNEIRTAFNESFATVRTKCFLQVRYFLKCALNVMRYEDTTLKKEISEESINALLDLITGIPMSSSDGEDLFALLTVLMNASMRPYVRSLVALCLERLNQPFCSVKYVVVGCLRAIVTVFPGTSALADHIELTCQAIENADTKTWPILKASLLAIKDKLPIFMALVPQIESLSSEKRYTKYVVDLFIELLRQLRGKVDMSELFYKCLGLITVDDEKLTSYASNIATAILEGKNVALDIDLGLLEKILNRGFECSRSETRKSLFDLCSAVSESKDGASSIIQDVIRHKIDRAFDFWSYDPSIYEHGQVPFCGLSNLGATCYMNSVLQQLFHTLQFRKVMFQSTFEECDKKELQLLFYRLELSEKGSVDTRPFCNVWKGWYNELIHVREQQDAGEFLNLILDQLPKECQAPFRGEIVSKICGVNSEYESENTEPFFTVPLDVKGLSSVEESFQSFLQEESFCGDNAIATEDGKIDAKKFVRIRTLPQMLVFHLKRWEYDIKNGRYKVCDRFAFPHILDVSPLLEDRQGEEYYELHGIVLHSGGVDGGHYISLIRIGGQWYEFNDSQVSPFDDNELEHEAFGGRNLGFSAFMLFYEKMPITEEIDISSNSEIVKQIGNENLQFASVQALFSEATALFVSRISDLQILLEYLLNILVHSSFSQHVDSLSSKIVEMLDTQENRALASQYFDEKSDKLLSIYKDCSIESIIPSVHRIIDKIIEFQIDDHIISLVDKIVGYFGTIANVWRQFEYVAHVPYVVLQRWESEIATDMKKKWSDILIHFVLAFYEGEVTKNVKEMVEFRTVFAILKIISHLSDPVDWMTLWGNVLQNPANATDYFLLLLEVNPAAWVDKIMSWLSGSRSKLKTGEIMRCAVGIICKTDHDVSELILSARGRNRENEADVARSFLYELRRGNSVLRDKLVEKCRRLLFATLFSESDANASIVQLILLEMFPDVPWFENQPPWAKIATVPTLRKPHLTWERWHEAENAKEIAEMRGLLTQLLEMEPEIRAFMEDCYMGMGTPTRMRGVKALEIIRWLIMATSAFDPHNLNFLLSLFRSCVDLAQSGSDTTVGLLFETIGEFPSEMISPYLEELFMGAFSKGVRASLLKSIFAQEQHLTKDLFERVMKMNIVGSHILSIVLGECPGNYSSQMDHVLQLLPLCALPPHRFAQAFDKCDRLEPNVVFALASKIGDELSPSQIATAIAYVYTRLCDSNADTTSLTNLMQLITDRHTPVVASEWKTRKLSKFAPRKLFDAAIYHCNAAFRAATNAFLQLTAVENEEVCSAMFPLLSPTEPSYYSAQACGIVRLVLSIGQDSEHSTEAAATLVKWCQRYTKETAKELASFVNTTACPWLLPVIVELVSGNDVFSDTLFEQLLSDYAARATTSMIREMIDGIVQRNGSESSVVNSLATLVMGNPEMAEVAKERLATLGYIPEHPKAKSALT